MLAPNSTAELRWLATKHDIAELICIIHTDPLTQLSDHLALYRQKGAPPFSHQDRLDAPLLSCDRVAAATGISSRHLTRLFTLEGSTPSRYLQDKRLERARLLLTSPQGRRLDIAEVAYRHGFSSQAHFPRAFKARYGMTASEARSR